MFDRIFGKNNWKNSLVGVVIFAVFIYLIKTEVIPVPDNWMTESVGLITMLYFLLKKGKLPQEVEK